MTRTQSVFENYATNNVDKLCAHYYDKISSIISQHDYWSEYQQQSNNHFIKPTLQIPSIFRPILNLLSEGMKEITFYQQHPRTNQTIIKIKSRRLTLLSRQVQWLKTHIFAPYYFNNSSLETRRFICTLSDFLKSPLTPYSLTTNDIDFLYYKIFNKSHDQDTTATSGLLTIAFKAPLETLQLRK